MPDFPTPSHRLHRRWRRLRDRLAAGTIRAGGLGVIVAVLAIGVFLAVEVVPLFAPARVTTEASRDLEGTGAAVGLVPTAAGDVLVIDRDGGYRRIAPGADAIDAARIPAERLDGRSVTGLSAGPDALVLALSGGEVLRVPRRAEARPDGPGTRRYTLFAGETIAALASAGDGERWWLAGRDAAGRVAVLRGDGEAVERFVLPDAASALALDPDGRLVLGDGHELAVWSLAAGEPRRLGRLPVLPDDRRITALSYLSGGETLLVGDSRGGVHRWLDRHDDAEPLLAAPDYAVSGDSTAVTRLVPVPGRRLAVALHADGGLALYQALNGRVWQGAPAAAESPLALAVSADGRRLWWLAADGLKTLTLAAGHAEVSWRTLWTPVLYEGHMQPRQRWQANVSSPESEAHFGLAPLAWGTLKAAFWALVFAVPLALAAAVHTAAYMGPALRARVRPALELMESLPGVVIGFVAGLVLAPWVDRHLAGSLLLLVVLPVGTLVAGMLQARLPAVARRCLPLAAAGLWLVPWLALLAWLSFSVSPLIEGWLFAGDLPGWLKDRWGLDYASRNALIVGLAMGFAVIPTIYALAEDALSDVPRSLDEGAQALGATRWQALTRVWLPAAGPGIFSAVMIGAGRAVGETMIVLMATGNTAIFGVSPFEGLRSIAANLAIELPEAAVGGSHYRVLFLSALVLFVFTFCVNTLAELVRQRLRRRWRRLGAVG
ncbi:ABC transporter permease subunit [Modicisalibacter coralii]|uniref:ABC transporter permease subunit n=1 Tax=Modicisalibacter coralii TaxID=2304602 RepID=UPI00100AE60B|nr:ABC transporter permease subunit [Halomonas coralii]